MKISSIKKLQRISGTNPDLSIFTDDLLGPDFSAPDSSIPDQVRDIKDEQSKIKMLKIHRRVNAFIDKDPDAEEYEEENEEGELENEPELKEPELTNHEQGVQHGFNPEKKATAEKWKQYKVVDIKSIPRIIAKGVDERDAISPQYQQVKDLPSVLKNPIRALSRQLFDLLTMTSTDDIQVLAHSKEHGPNSMEEVQAVEKWIHHSGKARTDMIEELRKKVGDVKMFQTEGITHLVISNSSGRFIFSWPSINDKVGKRTKDSVGLDQ